MRYFIEIAYKGTNYHGWQVQPNAISVQELINRAFSIVLQLDINVVGAGRTDAGVHAEQLFAHFDTEKKIVSRELLYKVNSLLPADIVILNICKTTQDAHARFIATSRSYEYRINFGKNPFTTETTWQLINKKLNVDLMNEAAEILLTFTNFKSFSRTHSEVKTYNCDITRAEWVKCGNQIIFHITADRFLRNMVRAIVGTLIDVGTGKVSKEDFIKIIESKDRKNAGTSAPAKGLFLTSVRYPKNIFLNE